MKKILFIHITFFSFLACKVVCQSSTSISNHSVNDSTTIDKEATAHPKSINLNNLSARFYPIGWSEDGKFAYVTEGTNSYACDGLPTYLIIYDAKADSILYSYLNTCPDQFWNEDYVTQKDLLVKYGIKATNALNVVPLEEISITNEYEVINKKQNIKRKVNKVDGYRDPDYLEYLGTYFYNNKAYGVNLFIVSESESEIVLLSSYY